MRLRVPAALILAVAGAISISCGGIVDPSQNNVTTHTGTVPVGSNVKIQFSASKTGELNVKVGTLSPASSAVIGVLWVQAGDGSCNGNLLQNNQFATANTTAISAQIQSGSYCIVMYDVGAFTQAENFSVTISRP